MLQPGDDKIVRELGEKYVPWVEPADVRGSNFLKRFAYKPPPMGPISLIF